MLVTADVAFGNPYLYRDHHGVIVLRFPEYLRRQEILALASRFLEEADLDSLKGARVIVTAGGYRVRR